MSNNSTKHDQVKNVITSLSSELTIQGIPNIIRSKRLFNQLIWIILLVSSSGICSYYSFKCIMDFLNMNILLIFKHIMKRILHFQLYLFVVIIIEILHSICYECILIIKKSIIGKIVLCFMMIQTMVIAIVLMLDLIIVDTKYQ